jgi:hypothetical protein
MREIQKEKNVKCFQIMLQKKTIQEFLNTDRSQMGSNQVNKVAWFSKSGFNSLTDSFISKSRSNFD